MFKSLPLPVILGFFAGLVNASIFYLELALFLLPFCALPYALIAFGLSRLKRWFAFVVSFVVYLLLSAFTWNLSTFLYFLCANGIVFLILFGGPAVLIREFAMCFYKNKTLAVNQFFFNRMSCGDSLWLLFWKRCFFIIFKSASGF